MHIQVFWGMKLLLQVFFIWLMHPNARLRVGNRIGGLIKPHPLRGYTPRVHPLELIRVPG